MRVVSGFGISNLVSAIVISVDVRRCSSRITKWQSGSWVDMPRIYAHTLLAGLGITPFVWFLRILDEPPPASKCL